MSKSNCEPALLSSLETLQHNLQDAGRWRDHNGYVPEVVK